MMRLGKFLFVFIIFIITFSVNSQDFGGYYKSFIMVNDFPGANPGISILNTIRGRLLWELDQVNTFHVAYALKPVIFPVNYDLTSSAYDQNTAYRLIDFNNQLYPVHGSTANRNFALYQNLDRLSLSFKLPVMDIILGRQTIAFGSAKVINPTDVLTPFLYQELDKEERTGVDALRIKVPVGMLGEIDMGYIFGYKFELENSASYVKFRFYQWETDFTTILMSFRNNYLVGFDISRAILGAGFWLETAYVFKHDYLRLSTGLDYNLSNGLYGFVEYHYNSAGKSRAGEYLDLYNTAAYTSGAVFWFGRHYLSPGLSYEITPLLSLASQFIVNLNDPSIMMSHSLEYSAFENIYVNVGAYFSLGRKTDVLPRSEFGTYPNVYYSSLRVYF